MQRYLDSGETEPLGELYNRYVPLVYGLCLKYLKGVEQAEDAVRQVCESLPGKVERYEIREFRVWIYSVAKNHCLQELRKVKREFSSDFSFGIMESDEVTHLLNRKEEEEVRFTALEKCLEQLPLPQRESIRRFFLEEKSYADIVDETNYNLKSVKSYIQNGKRNLKICMEKQGA